MRPARPLHGGDYEVRPVDIFTARRLVEEHHYARGASNTAVYLHGLYRQSEDECLGVAWWLPPTKPAALSVSPDWRGVLALSRLVIVPDMPTNAASFLLGRSVRMVRRDGRFHALVTYADEGQGHTGGIYRATNWEYVGAMKGHPSWHDTDGRRVAVKATRNRTYAEMEALGYARGPRTPKHKFIMRLRERQAGLEQAA